MQNQNSISIYVHVPVHWIPIHSFSISQNINTRTEEYIQPNNIQFESGHATRLLFRMRSMIKYVYTHIYPYMMELLNLYSIIWWSEVYNFVFSDGKHLSWVLYTYYVLYLCIEYKTKLVGCSFPLYARILCLVWDVLCCVSIFRILLRAYYDVFIL